MCRAFIRRGRLLNGLGKNAVQALLDMGHTAASLSEHEHGCRHEAMVFHRMRIEHLPVFPVDAFPVVCNAVQVFHAELPMGSIIGKLRAE